MRGSETVFGSGASASECHSRHVGPVTEVCCGTSNQHMCSLEVTGGSGVHYTSCGFSVSDSLLSAQLLAPLSPLSSSSASSSLVRERSECARLDSSSLAPQHGQCRILDCQACRNFCRTPAPGFVLNREIQYFLS